MEPSKRILYGRRRGRRLRSGQQALFDGLVRSLEIELREDAGSLDPIGLFPRPVRAVWLEIGFGAGEHLIAQAKAHPEIGFIGCEPFINGVVRLAGGLKSEGLDNVRLWRDDARVMIRALEPDTIERAFILFPDPWPKTRHHKRRIVSNEVLDGLARVMVEGAELRVATDDTGYLVWILEHLRRSPDFEWTARGPDDWRARPDDWPPTRYEQKALDQGRRCAYLRYRRRAKSSGEAGESA